MRIIPLFLAILVLPAQAEKIRLPSAIDQANSRSSRTIQDREAGFSAVFPEGWHRRTDVKIPGVALIVQAKDGTANCNVRSVYNERLLGFSSTEYLKRAFPSDDPSGLLDTYKVSGLNPTLLRTGKITISGTQAMFVEFDFVRGATSLRTFNVQFLQNGRLYTLGCTDLPNRYPTSLPYFGFFISLFRTIKN